MSLNKNFLNELHAGYTSQGVALAKNVIPTEIISKAKLEAIKLAKQAHPSTYNECVFWKKQGDTFFLEKYEPIINNSFVFNALWRYPSVLQIVSKILKDSTPNLLKDKLIYKAPGQNGYPLHQDYNWWHSYSKSDLCTVVIPLDRSNEENGGIEFFLGCHDECFLPKGENRALNSEERKKLAHKTSIIFDLNPGDLLIFHSLTPHFSSRNMSNKHRTQFYPTFCNSKVGQDAYTNQLKTHRRKLTAINNTNIYCSG